MERSVIFLLLFFCANAISIVSVDVQDAYVFNSPEIFVKVNCTSCEIYSVSLINNTPNTFSYETIFVPHYLINGTGIVEFLVEQQDCYDFGTEYNYTVSISSSEGVATKIFTFNITSPLEAKLDKNVVTSEISSLQKIHLLLKNLGSSAFTANISTRWDSGYTRIFNEYGIFPKNSNVNVSYTSMNTIELLPNKFGKGDLEVNITTNCSYVNASFLIPTFIYSESGLMKVRTLDFFGFIFKLFKPLLLS